jgi:high-affinity iron transporter
MPIGRVALALMISCLALVGCGDDPADTDRASQGSSHESAEDPVAVVDDINALLDDAVAAYEAGDKDEAAELVATAYLDNYEHIEEAVEEEAGDLNDALEPLLGAELRRQIEMDVPASEIEALVSEAQDLLAQAAQVLEP